MEKFEYKHSCGHKGERSGEFENAEAKKRAISFWSNRDCFRCIKTMKRRSGWAQHAAMNGIFHDHY